MRAGDNTTGPVQVTAEGNLLFIASAPSLGYQTYYLSDKEPGCGIAHPVQVTATDDSVTMANDELQVILSRDQGWAISSLRPILGGVLQPDIIPAGQAANALVFYKDLGNIYKFGNENNEPANFQVVAGKLSAIRLRVLEQGPLRARVEAQVAFDDGASGAARSTATYTLEYTLMVGEPMVRMAVTGAAPLPADSRREGTPYSVVVRFPFAGEAGTAARVDGVLRATPYHWHDQLPVPYWRGPTFQATHHFVVPSVKGVNQAALYHADIPAWAIDDDGAMIGCILRNTPGGSSSMSSGADGVNFGSHTHAYALRVPHGLDLPPAGSGVFRESFACATPLLGAYGNVPTAGVTPRLPVQVQFPAGFSLASVIAGDAILTAAKPGQHDPGDLVLRLYQPSNASQGVTLDLSDYIQATGKSSPQVLPVTALEQAIPGAGALPMTKGTVALTMDRALATLAITPGTTDRAGQERGPRLGSSARSRALNSWVARAGSPRPQNPPYRRSAPAPPS